MNQYSDELRHHGVKGQKWGVRRYRNYDGTLTEAGKKQQMYYRRGVRFKKTEPHVDRIFNSMSKEERDRLTYYENEYMTEEEASMLAKRILLRVGDTPVAFCDVFANDTNNYSAIAIGVTNDKQYRNRGYGKKAAKQVMKWYEKHKDDVPGELWWGVRSDNEPSIRIAKDLGFERNYPDTTDKYGKTWEYYIYNDKKKG